MSKAYDIVMANRQEIVDKLIAQMEQGYASTRAAWNRSATGRPYNPVSDAVYRGGNRFRLMIAAEAYGFKDSRWMTFKQASENNYQVASGAKGVLLEKWIFHKDIPKLDENNKPVIGEDGRPVIERVKLQKPIVNYFRVFNGEQIIGLPELQRKEMTEDYYSKTAETFERSSKCPVSYEKQDGAYYSPTEDKIHLPPREAFKNNETRLSVLLHEMAHSTGHESRLNRPIKNTFGSIEYAKEELNAELSSVFLESELGIKMDSDSEMLKDHSNYVKSWISVLKNDPNELFVACANAEQITDFLMENYEKQLEIEKGLIHPEGSVEYFTRNLGGTGLGEDVQEVKHQNFEDAFTAYRNAGLVDGKTLGVSIEGHQIDLVWFNTVNMDHVLYRVAQPPERYCTNLAVNELDAVRTNGNKLLDVLQKENTYIQLIQSVSEIEMKMTVDIQKNNMAELMGRFANNARPQDYFEIKLLNNEQTNSVELNVREIYANEVMDEKKLTINREDVIEKGISICVRKSACIVRNTLNSMLDEKYCSEEILNLLLNCVAAKMNFVFGGEPGSGKTECAKFFMQFIPKNERVITIEDSLEIHYPEINLGADAVELRISSGFSYTDAIKACLRQNPKWLMLSEARSTEVTSLLEQWSTGVNGFTTIHLDDLRKLPDRIQNMMSSEVDADRMENRIYRYVNLGILIRRIENPDGKIWRYIDQMCFYSREGHKNRIYMIVKDGEVISRELPRDILEKMKAAGIRNPFVCEKFKEYMQEGK